MGVALVVALAVVTHTGTTHWRTSETLFSHTLEIAPDNFFAHTNLGVAVEGRGDLKEAARHYDEAIRLNPTYSVALNNRGAVYAREGNLPEALILFDRALATSPQFSPAKYHRGLARELMGAPVEAMVEWVAILQYEPSFERARASLQIVVQRALSQSCDMLRQGATQRETTFAAILRDQTYSWAPVRNDDQVLQGHLQEFVRCLSKT
jgi:tetratricopeptide (TPR) repeat protein